MLGRSAQADVGSQAHTCAASDRRPRLVVRRLLAFRAALALEGHGSPTWSYVCRKLIHKLRASGRRSIGVDHLGFGRSDKPHRQREYSLERHVRLCGNVLFKGAHRSLHRSVREDGTGRSLMQAELRAYAEPHRSRDSRTGILAFARTTSRRSADVLALDGAGHLVPEAVTDELATAILELGNR
jgi:hypothetical protein